MVELTAKHSSKSQRGSIGPFTEVKTPTKEVEKTIEDTSSP